MKPLKLHLKTSLLASAVALVVLFVALLLISVKVANQTRDEQKQLAELEAVNLAQHLSIFPSQNSVMDLQRLTDFVSKTRPNVMTVRIWRLDIGGFSVTTASNGDQNSDEIPQDSQLSLKSGRASQNIAVSKNTGDDSIFRVFAPIVSGNRVTGAVEVVERLDTVSNIALQYLWSLSWIAAVTILLMLAAFYLLFQNMVYQPLDKLLTAMEKAKKGDLEAAVLENKKPDEIGKLTNNFNSMMAQINEMSEERRRQNEILSEKVGEATSELVHKNDQLETANLELFRATRRMTEMERLAAAGQTAAQFAHEVGTPLNLISGHVQLLQTKVPTESKEANRLQIINTQIERIEHIVRDMLDRTRFGAVELKSLNLNELLNKTVDTVEPTLQEKNVELNLDFSNDISEISGDADRLQQVFLNLINNALDAMPDGGKLSISTYKTREKICAEFSDSGIGMSRETSEKIFQTLFTTKERGRGTGLGLVVVKQILQEHSAEIEVESEPEKGAKFTICFPN